MNASNQPNLRISSKEIKRQYQIWNGYNHFLFKGKIYIGSEYYLGLLTCLYIQIYSWIYITFVLLVRINYNIENETLFNSSLYL